MAISCYACSKTSYWTTTPGAQIDSAPYATELKITDSTITDFAYNWTGCFYGISGLCWIRKSEFVGDTLKVYDLKYNNPFSTNNDLSTLKLTLTEAYLRKGRKLYPIHPDYPNIYGIWNTEDLTTTEPDSTGVEQFNVNWDGWSDKPVYINYKGVYQKRGKYKELREELEKRMAAGDTVVWQISYPREFLNDTIHWTPRATDKLGPLNN